MRPIVERTRDRLLELRGRTQPEVEAILADAEQQVRSLLRPEQQRRFDRRIEGRRRQRDQLLR